MSDDFDAGYKGDDGHGRSNWYNYGRNARKERDELDRKIEAMAMSSPRDADTSYDLSPQAPTAPATFSGTVKGTALIGAIFTPLYAYLELNLVPSFALLFWVLMGVIFGALAGVPLYGLIVVMRGALAVLRVAIKIAFWCGAAWVVYYIFSH